MITSHDVERLAALRANSLDTIGWQGLRDLVSIADRAIEELQEAREEAGYAIAEMHRQEDARERLVTGIETAAFRIRSACNHATHPPAMRHGIRCCYECNKAAEITERAVRA